MQVDLTLRFSAGLPNNLAVTKAYGTSNSKLEQSHPLGQCQM